MRIRKTRQKIFELFEFHFGDIFTMKDGTVQAAGLGSLIYRDGIIVWGSVSVYMVGSDFG